MYIFDDFLVLKIFINNDNPNILVGILPTECKITLPWLLLASQGFLSRSFCFEAVRDVLYHLRNPDGELEAEKLVISTDRDKFLLYFTPIL